MRADDLSVGQWVAIQDDLQDCEPAHSWPACQRESRVDGTPLKIVSISLPFLVVTDGYSRFVLDSRDTILCLLSKSFVRALTSRERVSAGQGGYVITNQPAARREPSGTPERGCPVCGERLIERYAHGVWQLACRQCGFSGSRGATT